MTEENKLICGTVKSKVNHECNSSYHGAPQEILYIVDDLSPEVLAELTSRYPNAAILTGAKAKELITRGSAERARAIIENFGRNSLPVEIIKKAAEPPIFENDNYITSRNLPRKNKRKK